MTDTCSVIIATSIIVCGNLADGGTVESTLLLHPVPPAEQVGQLSDVGGYAPCLVASEQLGCRATARASGRWPCDATFAWLGRHTRRQAADRALIDVEEPRHRRLWLALVEQLERPFLLVLC